MQDLMKMAEIAEDFSFDSLWVGDSLIDSPRYEPMALLGAIAARTNKVKIGGSIIQPHFRNPILLALTWATLDQLSNGRTILTLGIGGGTPQGVAKEAELVGIDVKKRGKALEESVQILRKLWSGEILDHHGEVYDLIGAKLGYLPIQCPPPIWIAAGAYVPKQHVETISATPGYTTKTGLYTGAFRRVARLADGWFTIMTSPEEFEKNSNMISDLTREYGRKPNDVKRAVECWLNVGRDKQKTRTEVASIIEGYFANKVDTETVERWSIYGTADDCIRKIQKYVDAGAETIKLIMGSHEPLSLLDETAKSVLPSF